MKLTVQLLTLTARTRILLTLVALAVALSSLWFFWPPQPFTEFVPADSLGYFEIPKLSDALRLLRDPDFLPRAWGHAPAAKVRSWMEWNLARFSLSEKRLNSASLGLIISSATVERDQTVKVFGVLVARYHSVWVRHFNIQPQTIAEKLSDDRSFVSMESLHGLEIAVLTRGSTEQKIYIALKNNAVLLSNQRESLAQVLAVMDGREPSILKSPAWLDAPPNFKSGSVGRGFLSGSAVVHLARDFLVQNFSAFDDAARTARFLSSLGLDSLRSITYSASIHPAGLDEQWDYSFPASTTRPQAPLFQFVHQPGIGLEVFSARSIPANAISARFFSLAKRHEIWNAFANSLGVLTNQEAPENRDLMIRFLEGGLGFRIERDLLTNLGDTFALYEVNAGVRAVDSKTPSKAATIPEGWILALSVKNRAALEKVFSKIVAEDRTPRVAMVGSSTVFFSDLQHKSSHPLSGVVESTAAYAVKEDTLYFSTSRDLLMASLQALNQSKTLALPSWPASFEPQAPYLFMTLSPPDTTEDKTPVANPRPVSFAQLRPTAAGFSYQRISPCGFLGEFLMQNFQSRD